MKIRISIAYFALGVFLTATIGEFSLLMNNEKWKSDAVHHHCGLWRMDFTDPNSEPYFQWLDDYLIENRENQRQNSPKSSDAVRL